MATIMPPPDGPPSPGASRPRVGDTVRLKPEARYNKSVAYKSCIDRVINEAEGRVQLTQPLEGLYYWNLDDLEVISNG